MGRLHQPAPAHEVGASARQRTIRATQYIVQAGSELCDVPRDAGVMVTGDNDDL